MPVLALLLGAASALVFHIDTSFAIAVLIVATAAAWSAWRCERDRLAVAAMAIAFFGAAAALTADAQDRALDQSFGPYASPVAVRLRLLEDASPQDGFTALQATVLAVRARGAVMAPSMVLDPRQHAQRLVHEVGREEGGVAAGVVRG